MSCSARLPAYLLLVAAFFTANQGLILMSIYLVGILVAALTAIMMSKTFLKHDKTQFVMELPPYRKPTARNATLHMWSKGKQYLQKMATVILAASIIVWALGYFPAMKGRHRRSRSRTPIWDRWVRPSSRWWSPWASTGRWA